MTTSVALPETLPESNPTRRWDSGSATILADWEERYSISQEEAPDQSPDEIIDQWRRAGKLAPEEKPPQDEYAEWAEAYRTAYNEARAAIREETANKSWLGAIAVRTLRWLSNGPGYNRRRAHDAAAQVSVGWDLDGPVPDIEPPRRLFGLTNTLPAAALQRRSREHSPTPRQRLARTAAGLAMIGVVAGAGIWGTTQATIEFADTFGNVLEAYLSGSTADTGTSPASFDQVNVGYSTN